MCPHNMADPDVCPWCKLHKQENELSLLRNVFVAATDLGDVGNLFSRRLTDALQAVTNLDRGYGGGIGALDNSFDYDVAVMISRFKNKFGTAWSPSIDTLLLLEYFHRKKQ